MSHLLLTSSKRLVDHHRRVGRLSEALALRLGMDEAEAARVGQAGTLHDIGMMLVPEELLDQTGPLSANERDVIHHHSLWGSELLRMALDPTLDLAAKVALQHHERFNGTGYPLRLAGEEICVEARIVAVCAVYDALRHPREGKAPLGEAAALDVLRNGDQEMRAGGFDPVVLDAFARLLAETHDTPVFSVTDEVAAEPATAVVDHGTPVHDWHKDAGEMRDCYKVAIVDDDDAVRQSTAGLLRGAGHHVESYTSGAEFLASNVPHDLGCILLDLCMPGLDGLAVMRALRERGNAPPILVLTGHGDVPTAVEAMRLGAVDFLEKPYPPKDLAAAVARACATRATPAPGGRAVNADARRKIAALTERQRDVLRGILKGRQNKLIAHDLGLSTRTVESYRAQLFEKLNASGTAGAVKLAIAAGLDAA